MRYLIFTFTLLLSVSTFAAYTSIDQISKKYPLFSKSVDLEQINLEDIPDIERSEIAKYFKAQNKIDEYDIIYEVIQTQCLFLDEDQTKLIKNCEIADEVFGNINELLHEDQVDGLEMLTGISQDDLKWDNIIQKNTIDTDPNRELFEESEQTPGRYSPANKIGPEPQEIDAKIASNINLEQVICDISLYTQNTLDSPLPPEVISKLQGQLEAILLIKDASPEELKLIFCTLFNYYEATENYDRMIDFLYLHEPEGTPSCSNSEVF